MLVGVEGTGAYGAGLARFLRPAGVMMAKIDRPDRKTCRWQANPTRSAFVDLRGLRRALARFVTMGSQVRWVTGPAKRKTKGEATSGVQRLERERDSDKVKKAGRAPTVEQWMTTYLDTIAVQKLRPRSYDDYWSKTRNWIIPCSDDARSQRLACWRLDHARRPSWSRSGLRNAPLAQRVA